MKSSSRIFLKGSLASFVTLPVVQSANVLAEKMGNPQFIDVDGIRTRYFEAGENLVSCREANSAVTVILRTFGA